MEAKYHMNCVSLEAGSTFSNALDKNMAWCQLAPLRLKKNKDVHPLLCTP